MSFFYEVILVLIIVTLIHELGHYFAFIMLGKKFTFSFKQIQPFFYSENIKLKDALVIYLLGIFTGLFFLLLMSSGKYLYINLVAYFFACYYDLKGLYHICKTFIRGKK